MINIASAEFGFTSAEDFCFFAFEVKLRRSFRSLDEGKSALIEVVSAGFGATCAYQG
jgi:hypothetical protein